MVSLGNMESKGFQSVFLRLFKSSCCSSAEKRASITEVPIDEEPEGYYLLAGSVLEIILSFSGFILLL